MATSSRAYYLAQNDTAQKFRSALKNPDGSSHDMTGRTGVILIRLRDENGPTGVILSRPVSTVVDPGEGITEADGVVEYAWTPADWTPGALEPGTHDIKVETDGASGPLSFPNHGFDALIIEGDLIPT